MPSGRLTGRGTGLAVLLAGVAAAMLLATWLPATTGDTTAASVLGQASMLTNSAGAGADGLSAPLSVAIDRTSTPDHLYVADTKNNRVLGFRDAEEFANGSPADIVIGQPNLCSTACNAGRHATGATLCAPSAVTVDNRGVLYIADAGNNRVLVYQESPFIQFEEAGQNAGFNATHVLGQATFNGSGCNRSTGGFVPPNGATLCNPQGLAVNQDDQLFIADSSNNRVIEYYNPIDGNSANIAIGQRGFSEYKCALGGAPNTANASSLCAPRGLAIDSNGNLYVADQNDNRVTEYDTPQGTGEAAHLVFGQPSLSSVTPGGCAGGVASAVGLCMPQAVALDDNDDLYISDTGNSRVLEYDDPSAPGPSTPGQPGSSGDTTADTVFGHRGSFTATAPNDGGVNADSLAAPDGIALDEAGSLYVADTGNNRALKYNSASAPLTGSTKITPAATPAHTPCPPANLNPNPASTHAPPINQRTQPQAASPISAAPKSINFRKAAFFDSTDVIPVTKSVTLTNKTGTDFSDTLAVVATATGTDFSADFVATDTAAPAPKQCNGTVPAHKKCSISVTFTPSGIQKEKAILQVQDSSSNVVASVALSGSGVAGPIGIAPKVLSFPKTKNGNVSPKAKNLKITSKFASPIEISISNIAVTLKDGTTGSFEYSIDLTNCGGGSFPVSVDKATPCVVAVTFTPFTGGKKPDVAYLTVSDDAAPKGTQQVKLTGIATGAAAPTPTPAGCNSPSMTCNGQCVDVTSDPNNCGSCGLSCDPANEGTCSSSSCSCGINDTQCLDGSCANTNSDPNNCGTCGTVCPSGQTCSGGTCVAPGSCNPPSMQCGTQCIDVTSDPNNCGNCNVSCDPANGGTCSSSTCTCGGPDQQCASDGSCQNTNTDPNNCGSCGNSCGPGNSCASGSCQAGCVGSEPNLCNGTCTNTQTDNNNCGQCGVVCNLPGNCTTGACPNGTASPTPTPAPTPTAEPGPEIVPNVLFRFVTIPVGASQSETVTIVNQQSSMLNFTGSAPGIVTSQTPGVASDYVVNDGDSTGANGCLANGVQAFGSCKITVVFTPSAPGARIATLTLQDDFASLLPQTAALVGSGSSSNATPTPVPGTEPSAPKITPNLQSFGSEPLGSSSAAFPFKVTNSSITLPLTISAVSFSGADPGDFAETDNCTSAPVPASGSCTVTVTFTPTAAGSRIAALTVAGAFTGFPPAATLTGLGQGPLPHPPPVLSPSTLPFGTVQVGVTSGAQIVTAKNTSGSSQLVITDVKTNDSDFAADGSACEANPIPPGGTCQIPVTFSPTKVGPQIASLTTVSDGTGTAPGPTSVQLTGTGSLTAATPTPAPGQSPPPPQIAPSSLSFGGVAVGNTSNPKNVTITNKSSTLQLVISAINPGGADPLDFGETDTCTTNPVAPLGNCTISVTFSPTEKGTRTATFTLQDNAPTTIFNPQTFSVSGVGQ